jgi:hypothetical protein
MKYYLQQAQMGLRREGIVAAFNMYKNGTTSCSNATSVALGVDTVVAMEGLEWDSIGVPPTNEGWWVHFGTSTFSNWAASGAVGVVYKNLTISSLASPNNYGNCEIHCAGNFENSACCASLSYMRPLNATGGRMGIFQDSDATRTTVSGSDRLGGILLAGPSAIGARYRNAASQSLTAATEAQLTLGTRVVDDALFGSTANQLTVPTDGAGWYFIQGHHHAGSGGATHFNHRTSLEVNGTTRIATGVTDAHSGTKTIGAAALYYLSATDYVRALGRCSSTRSTVNTNTAYAALGMVRVNRDDLPGACVTRTTLQSIVASTPAAISFNSAVRDNWGMSDIGGANPTRLTVPAGHGGWYIVVGNLWWTALTSGTRYWGIYKNGNTQWEAKHAVLAAASATVNDPAWAVGMVLKLEPGDYIELIANSSVNADVTAGTAFLAMAKVDI